MVQFEYRFVPVIIVAAPGGNATDYALATLANMTSHQGAEGFEYYRMDLVPVAQPSTLCGSCCGERDRHFTLNVAVFRRARS